MSRNTASHRWRVLFAHVFLQAARLALFPNVKKVPVCALELLPMQGAVRKNMLRVFASRSETEPVVVLIFTIHTLGIYSHFFRPGA